MAVRMKDIARHLGVSVAGQQSVLALSRYSTSQIPTFYQPAFATGNVRSGIWGGIACARRWETAITPGRSSAWRDSRNEIRRRSSPGHRPATPRPSPRRAGRNAPSWAPTIARAEPRGGSRTASRSHAFPPAVPPTRRTPPPIRPPARPCRRSARATGCARFPRCPPPARHRRARAAARAPVETVAVDPGTAWKLPAPGVSPPATPAAPPPMRRDRGRARYRRWCPDRRPGGGKVRTKVVGNTKKKTLHSDIREHVLAGSALFTDALKSYEGLDEFQHEVVD